MYLKDYPYSDSGRYRKNRYNKELSVNNEKNNSNSNINVNINNKICIRIVSTIHRQ